MILAVAGSSSTAIAPHFGVVLRLYLQHAILLVHGGQPHPVDRSGGETSIDAWATEVAAGMLPSTPVIIPPIRRLRDRVASWCSMQRRAGETSVLLAFPGGRGTKDSVAAFRERGLEVVEVPR